MAQPLAVALHALDRAALQPKQKVAVFGIGGIGGFLLAAQKASWDRNKRGRRPATVMAVDIDPARLAVAAALGITIRVDARTCDPVRALRQMTDGVGVDVAIEATGNPLVIAQALASLKQGGRLLQVGIPTNPVRLPLGEVVMREQEILTTNGQICQRHLPHALTLLTTTDLAKLIGYQVIDLKDLVEQGLLPLAEHRASAKILVRIP